MLRTFVEELWVWEREQEGIVELTDLGNSPLFLQRTLPSIPSHSPSLLFTSCRQYDPVHPHSKSSREDSSEQVVRALRGRREGKSDSSTSSLPPSLSFGTFSRLDIQLGLFSIAELHADSPLRFGLAFTGSTERRGPSLNRASRSEVSVQLRGGESFFSGTSIC